MSMGVTVTTVSATTLFDRLAVEIGKTKVDEDGVLPIETTEEALLFGFSSPLLPSDFASVAEVAVPVDARFASGAGAHFHSHFGKRLTAFWFVATPAGARAAAELRRS